MMFYRQHSDIAMLFVAVEIVIEDMSGDFSQVLIAYHLAAPAASRFLMRRAAIDEDVFHARQHASGGSASKKHKSEWKKYKRNSPLEFLPGNAQLSMMQNVLSQ